MQKNSPLCIPDNQLQLIYQSTDEYFRSSSLSLIQISQILDHGQICEFDSACHTLTQHYCPIFWDRLPVTAMLQGLPCLCTKTHSENNLAHFLPRRKGANTLWTNNNISQKWTSTEKKTTLHKDLNPPKKIIRTVYEPPCVVGEQFGKVS